MVRKYVSQHDQYGGEITLTKEDLARRIRLFNSDINVKELGIKIGVTGSSETYAYHTQLCSDYCTIRFMIYATGDWGLRSDYHLSSETLDLYYRAWELWKLKGLSFDL